MEGWIKLHRQVLDSEVFASAPALKIWVWLLLKARRKEGFVTIKIGAGEHVFTLKRGQLLFGRMKAEEALNLNGSLIYKWIHKFEKPMGMVSIESNSHYTVISIVNFDKYNDELNSHSTATVLPPDSHRPTTVPPSNTNKTEETVKTDKKEETIYLVKIGLKSFKEKPSEIISILNQQRYETMLQSTLSGINTTELLEQFDKEHSASEFNDMNHFFNALKKIGKEILSPSKNGTHRTPKILSPPTR